MNFPSNPALNDEYEFQGKRWKWNGFSWELTGLYQIYGPEGMSGYSGKSGYSGVQGYSGYSGLVGYAADYDIGTYVANKPLSIEPVIHYALPHAIQFYQNFPLSIAKANIATTADKTFSIRKNNVEVGTITFFASGTNGTFSSTGIVTFLPGDILSVLAPAAQDATLQQISITINGIRI